MIAGSSSGGSPVIACYRLFRRLHICYGMLDSKHATLVYNPTGALLPTSQQWLEDDYRCELRSRYGIEYTRLFTITNMPISRFLAEAATIDGLMCRSMLSVDWQGNLFDCDFNQMFDLPVNHLGPRNILALDHAGFDRLQHREIVTGKQSFGCTAGELFPVVHDVLDGRCVAVAGWFQPGA